jgi:3-oxoacyl-[acyl-carrier-protein] synthase II
MSGTRVVITGTGWVTPLGHSVEQVWHAMMQGRSGVGRISRFEAATFKTNFAAEVRDFHLSKFLPAHADHASAGLNAQFALGAAAQAFAQAGLDKYAKLNPRRFGLYLGSGEGTLDFANYAAAHIGGWNAETRRVDGAKWTDIALKRMEAVREIEQEANMTISHVAWAFGCRGPSSNCLTACAASIQAIGEAFEILRRGDADVMFAGGAHTMVHPLGVTGFIRLTALSAKSDDHLTVPRPFDQTRDGFVMGEGAGMLVLETLEHAQARGATILGEITGYGSSADAFRITDMHPQGAGPSAAMEGAIRQAGIDPLAKGSDGRPMIHYISAHGTGTKENDKIETAAIKRLFGPNAPQIPISSIKSMLGHLIAAAGVSNVISALQAIRTGMVPPTINYRTPDAGLDLDYVPNTPRDLRAVGVRACLCNAYGFGGQNDCVVVQKFE